MTSVEAKNFLASIDSIPMACNDAPQEFIDKLNMAMEALREDKSIWLSTDDLPHEIWREIEGYNGDYLASIFGRIKSFKFGECRIMKQCNGVRGYQLIELSKGNVQKSFRAHRIIAETFLPNAGNKEQVNHLFGTKNNAVWQIEWATAKENMRHAVKKGYTKSGADTYNAKLTDEQAAEILSSYVRGSHEFGSVALGEKYGISHNQILRIIHGETYKETFGERQPSTPRKPPTFLTGAEKDKIRRSYIRGSVEHGAVALSKIYGVHPDTIRVIVGAKRR